MQETLKALRNLQELDRDIFRVEQEVKRLPAERDKRRAEIDARLHRRDEFDQAIRELSGKLKEIEDHTTIQRQRLRKLEHEANSSRSDAALLAAYQHEMRTLKREISEAEEEGLKYVEQIDTVKGSRDDLQASIDEEETVYAEFSSNVEKELAEATSKLSVLTEDRKGRMSDSVPPDVLDVYEKLLQAREGSALAELDGRVCQGCYMEVPTNVYVRIARAIEVVQCPNCNRILFLRSAS